MSPTPLVPPLGPHHVHVWRYTLDADPTLLDPLLAPDERRRAQRFLKPDLRRRFTVARGNMRRLLGAYTRTPADLVQLSYGSAGKPALVNSPLHFNLSHSKDLALLAIATGGPVGIDLERERPIDVQGVGRRVFSEYELRLLAETPEHDQVPLFFRLWVRHEAQVKALGTTVGSDATVPVYDLPIDPPFHAALATHIPTPRITRFQL